VDKFTPGPWHVYQEKPHYYSVGTDYAHDRGRDQNIVRDVRKEANARLMAAAPEMFDALVGLLAYINARIPGEESVAYLEAQSALAKARGEVSRG
jgi:hypothetical protein